VNDDDNDTSNQLDGSKCKSAIISNFRAMLSSSINDQRDDVG